MVLLAESSRCAKTNETALPTSVLLHHMNLEMALKKGSSMRSMHLLVASPNRSIVYKSSLRPL